MTPIKNPKNKGGEYERKVAKILSKWWTNGERDDVIWRSQNSGGRATNRYQKGKSTANAQGDLAYSDEIAKPLFDIVTIEVKRGYPQTNPLDIIDANNHNELETFWKQVTRDSVIIGTNPILILKRDRRDPVIFMYKLFYNKIVKYHGNVDTDMIQLKYDNHNIIGFRFDVFLEWCDPRSLERMYENTKNEKISG